ncbi:MAG: proline dehydrogenase family protein [Gaiellaceae bacterium]
MAILDRTIVRLLPAVPKPVVRRLSSRYIAGATLEDAVRVVKGLNAQGKLATVNVLGEEVSTAGEAAAMVDTYAEVFDAIDRERLDSNVSVKATGLGLRLGVDLCRENLQPVIQHAAERGNAVRVEMEDATTTDDILALYRGLRADGFDNVGIVLQASLRRTLRDVRELADLRPSVRLCKGIYIEPPAIQFRDFEQVRASFVQALDRLLEQGAYAAIATHDEWLIEQALERVQGLAPQAYEFQMLLGVRPDLGNRLVRDGHRLRIYVPFGQQWYEYSLRRLQENPKIAGYIASDTLTHFLR